MGVLAPIRAGSMSDDAASDWLAAIIAKTAHMSDAMFREGCRQASEKCAFHGEVLRTILAANAEVEEYTRKLDAISKPFLADHSPKRPAKLANDNAAQRLIERAARNIEA